MSVYLFVFIAPVFVLLRFVLPPAVLAAGDALVFAPVALVLAGGLVFEGDILAEGEAVGGGADAPPGWMVSL